ncbi:MAG: hypothetical protein WBQ78_02280 [Gammaproteobacteria bacterium]
MSIPVPTLHDYAAEVSEHSSVRRGFPLPLGTRAYRGGVNFALFSRHASRVRLELFDQAADVTPSRFVDFGPVRNRMSDMWHVWLKDIRPGQLYAYRVDGPYQPREGHRFNFHKLLLDPFATAIAGMPDWDFGPARGYDPSAPEPDLVCSLLNDAGAM